MIEIEIKHREKAQKQIETEIKNIKIGRKVAFQIIFQVAVERIITSYKTSNEMHYQDDV